MFARTFLPALLGLASLFTSHAAQAQTKPVLTTLHRFAIGSPYGSSTFASLTPGTDGNLYGVTATGGVDDNGTIFQMTPAGKFTTLHVLLKTEGKLPQSALVQGKDGAFYGVATFGGTYNFGSIFRITPAGQFATLYSWKKADGGHPNCTLLAAPDGSFYGTTKDGGPKHYGTLFRVTVDGTLTTLHTCSLSDGAGPGSVVFGPDGALYGATGGGGVESHGTVFRMTTGGAYSVLHFFNGTDGGFSLASLSVGPDNALYGTTVQGGINDYGVAYKITTSGQFTLLHKFSQDGRGTDPYGTLTLGADGNFYGTTAFGGTNDQGTVFSMTPAGQVTTLYKFHTAFDGEFVYAGVVFGSNGLLYGATYDGGVKGGGTLYKLTLP